MNITVSDSYTGEIAMGKAEDLIKWMVGMQLTFDGKCVFTVNCEKSKLNLSNIYNICNARKFYTRGTNAEYSNLLSNCHDMTVDEIARDIWQHSDGYTYKDVYDIIEELNTKKSSYNVQLRLPANLIGGYKHE